MIGCGGSGKTTLARALGRRLRVPVVHADLMRYGSDGRPVPEHAWRAAHEKAIAADAWVFDGTKPSLLDQRLARADAAIFLDVSRLRCLVGVLRRRARYRGRVVPEKGVADVITIDLLRWIWHFPRVDRPKVVAALERHRVTTDIVVLRSWREVRDFVASVPHT